MTSLAGITDVALLAGVSTATVSRALRGLPNVSERTRDRVVKAAHELGYVPSPSASSLASGRTHTIAIVTPFMSRWFFAQVVEGFEVPVRTAGYDLLLYHVGELGQDRRRAFDPETLRKRIDAVAVINLPLTGDEVAALADLEIPVAMVGAMSGDFPGIRIDDQAAARIATRHLIALGHSRIAHIGGLDDQTLLFTNREDRRRGYQEALREAGWEPDPDLDSDGAYTVEGGEEAMMELLTRAEPPTAVFAASDEMAFGAIRVLRRAGLDVPGDLSIVGIDDHEMSRLFDLTTVAQPVRRQGAMLAEMLLDALHAPTADGKRARTSGIEQRVVVPTRLVVRGSTAPPKTRLARLG